MLAVGWCSRRPGRRPAPDSVDVGFLQDMRAHHDQAVLIGLTYLSLNDTDPGLRAIAGEVLLGPAASRRA